jgi:dienelactone hydrolase
MTDIATRLARAEALLPANALAHVYTWFLIPRWYGHEGRFWYRVRTRQGARFVAVDPQAGTRAPAFDHDALAAALSAKLDVPVTPGDLPFRDIIPGPDGVVLTHGATRLHLSHDGRLTDGAAAPVPGLLPSPDGRQGVFLRDHNLHLIDLDTGSARALTSSGVPGYGWGEEPGGTMDSLSDATGIPPAAQWSPCGRWLLVFRIDEREVVSLPLAEYAPAPGGRPTAQGLRVPLVGDPHLGTAGYAVIDTASGHAVPVDMPPFPAMESPFWFLRQGLGSPAFWTADSALYLTRRAPGGREQTLYRADPATGATTALIVERGDTPVFLNAFEFARPNWRILPETGEILWYSERDGRGRLWLHAADGRALHPIGSDDHTLRDLLAVDPATRTVWYTVHGACTSGNPYHRHLVRASIDGGPAKVLTPELAEHMVWSSPCGRWFVDLYGRPDLPSVTVLRDRDGTPVLQLEVADSADLPATGYRPPEPVTTTAADGMTRLHGALFLPPDFDPNESYPVLDAIYGWSTLTVVPHAYLLDTGGPLDGGIEIATENMFMPAATAALGFAVLVLDARGTPYRDRAFQAPGFNDPVLAACVDDHAAAIRQLAATRPWMDQTRVGIFGHSGGGHMAAKAMMLHPDLFRAGVASAGNHDMRLYHAAWADLWGATPDELAAKSTLGLADRLQGALLLAHGDLDENVHPAHTHQLVAALVEAGKDFDLMILPGRHHDFTLDPYFLRRRWDFFVRHLLGEGLPSGVGVKPGDWSAVT